MFVQLVHTLVYLKNYFFIFSTSTANAKGQVDPKTVTLVILDHLKTLIHLPWYRLLKAGLDLQGWLLDQPKLFPVHGVDVVDDALQVGVELCRGLASA